MYLVLIAALIVACRSQSPVECSSHAQCTTGVCDFGIGGNQKLSVCADDPCTSDADCQTKYGSAIFDDGPAVGLIKCLDEGGPTCTLQFCETNEDCTTNFPPGAVGNLCDDSTLPGMSFCIECKADPNYQCTDTDKPVCWIDQEDPSGMDNVCTECNEKTQDCTDTVNDYCDYDPRWDDDDENNDPSMPTFCETKCDKLQAVENITCSSEGANACGMATLRVYDEADCTCDTGVSPGCIVRECTDNAGCLGEPKTFNDVCDTSKDEDWYCRPAESCADYNNRNTTDWCFVNYGAPFVCVVPGTDSDGETPSAYCDVAQCSNNLNCEETIIYPFCNTASGQCMEATTAQTDFTDENEYCSRQYDDTSYVAKANGDCAQVFCTDNNGCANRPGYICDVANKRCDRGCDGNQTICALQSTYQDGVMCQASGVCAPTDCATSPLTDCVSPKAPDGFICGPDAVCIEGCTDDAQCANDNPGDNPQTGGRGADWSMKCGADGLCGRADCSSVNDCRKPGTADEDLRLTCIAGTCAVACRDDGDCRDLATQTAEVRQEDIQYYTCNGDFSCDYSPPDCTFDYQCVRQFGGPGGDADYYKCEIGANPTCYYSDGCANAADCVDEEYRGLGATCPVDPRQPGVCVDPPKCTKDYDCGAESVQYAQLKMDRETEVFPYQIMCNTEHGMCDPKAYPKTCTKDSECAKANGFVCSQIKVPTLPYDNAVTGAFEGYYGVCVQECTSDAACNMALGSFGLTDDFECDTVTGQCQFSNEAECTPDAGCDGIEDTCRTSPFKQRICYKSCTTDAQCKTAYEGMYYNAELITCKVIGAPTPREGGSFCDTFTVMNDINAITTTAVVATTKTPGQTTTKTPPAIEGANTYGVITAVAITAFITQWMV